MNEAHHPPESWPQEGQELYFEFLQLRSQRIQNPRNHLRIFDRFLAYQLECGLTFRELPPSVLEGYLEKWPGNTGPLITLLRSWLRFLYQRKVLLLPVHEFLKYRRPGPALRPPLTYRQVVRLLDLLPLDQPCGLRDRAFLEMAYGTGLRSVELSRLDISDLDLAEKMVHVESSKNGHSRKVPLTAWSCHFVCLYLQKARPQLTSPLSSNALWLSPRGTRLPAKAVGVRLHEFYRVRERLGFPVTIHQLRHACATHLLTAGAPLTDVQTLLGHLDLDSTQIYTQISQLHLHKVHRKCHPRNLPEWNSH